MKLIINEKLYLELVKLSDAETIFNIINTQREYLGEWLPFVQYIKEVADEEIFIKSALETMEQTKEYVFCIRKDEKLVGLISFIKPDIANQKTEIGYWISKDYQKQGIVTQATKRMYKFAFNDLGMNRVQLRCAVGNLPSKSIPKRLGFTFEGIERRGERVSEGVFRDLEVYSILKSEM
ncbi:GNAT family N-acetyltransferase [Capnocytophaga catalasegens]|uniref:GNAT family N-acetyltransferase n=1 Tax=Capnocytophaga catalasegens TaxID=1004260 RepID=A0AAV5AWX2_9FLAO|nr:GNAT family protein [Capnocytophaga catalasegens]GIZ14206.1 GNAT family N-acetyltransferase [Capnocytophaga catalasegens]GJM50386.1 GNAT family N-acetyltransferase [Capnocytophaga catalasegens]GJM52669.1 GNAT family N-acetyltransferase [Capnocytophaga catalasegens]